LISALAFIELSDRDARTAFAAISTATAIRQRALLIRLHSGNDHSF